jgi:hypothetical protein
VGRSCQGHRCALGVGSRSGSQPSRTLPVRGDRWRTLRMTWNLRACAVGCADTEEVTGSNPVSPTRVSPSEARIARLRFQRRRGIKLTVVRPAHVVEVLDRVIRAWRVALPTDHEPGGGVSSPRRPSGATQPVACRPPRRAVGACPGGLSQKRGSRQIRAQVIASACSNQRPTRHDAPAGRCPPKAGAQVPPHGAGPVPIPHTADSGS